MKTIIAGSRSFVCPADIVLVERAIQESGFRITEIVSGMARGVDSLAVTYAALHHIPLRPIYAQWHHHGQWAGGIRNVRMADYADQLIAVWDEESPGTMHMIKTARAKGLPVYVLAMGL